MNIFRTGILIAGLTALFLFCGFLIGGESGMIIALLLALAMNGFAYWNSDKIVLRMYGAREVNRQSAPAFYGGRTACFDYSTGAVKVGNSNSSGYTNTSEVAVIIFGD